MRQCPPDFRYKIRLQNRELQARLTAGRIELREEIMLLAAGLEHHEPAPAASYDRDKLLDLKCWRKDFVQGVILLSLRGCYCDHMPTLCSVRQMEGSPRERAPSIPGAFPGGPRRQSPSYLAAAVETETQRGASARISTTPQVPTGELPSEGR